MNSNQDWFLMTGDLIINLRSTKTGDSFLFNNSNNSNNSKKQQHSKKLLNKNHNNNINNNNDGQTKTILDNNQNQVINNKNDEDETTILKQNEDIDDKGDCLDGIRSNLEQKLNEAKETNIDDNNQQNDNNKPTSTTTTSATKHQQETNNFDVTNKTNTFTSSKISNSSSGNSSGIAEEEFSQSQSYSDCLCLSSPPPPASTITTNDTTKPYSNCSSDFQFYFDNKSINNNNNSSNELINNTPTNNNHSHNNDNNKKTNKENCYENIIDCKYLSKSQESNLYNLIEDSKSIDEISLDSDNTSLLYYSSSSPNNKQQQHHGIDTPSASRLAKRLFNLEGFKKSDVARHLCKNNEFCRTVAEEYLKLFDFTNQELDDSLRNFLSYFHLIGETQERERVLVYFSKRYNECNPMDPNFKSVDSIHTLTCALMLLNTDLHEENIQRKMSCSNFILNLSGMNDGEDYPSNYLKYLYYSVKNNPLGWIDDEDTMIIKKDRNVFSKITTISKSISSPYATLPRKFNTSPFVEVPNPSFAIEYKKGYIRRKCCYDSNGRKTSFGKRSWKLFYATLRDLVLYLHKDENGFCKSQLQESFANSIRIHHSIASIANDYPKKKFVFRLITADYAEYLFETSDSKELQSWVETINTTAASLSAPTLPMAVSSDSRKFKKEIFPVSHTKLLLRDQLKDQENKLLSLQKELEILLEKSCNKKSYHKEFLEKETYLQHEIKRYRVYISCLKRELNKYPEQQQQQIQSTTTDDHSSTSDHFSSKRSNSDDESFNS